MEKRPSIDTSIKPYLTLYSYYREYYKPKQMALSLAFSPFSSLGEAEKLVPGIEKELSLLKHQDPKNFEDREFLRRALVWYFRNPLNSSLTFDQAKKEAANLQEGFEVDYLFLRDYAWGFLGNPGSSVREVLKELEGGVREFGVDALDYPLAGELWVRGDLEYDLVKALFSSVEFMDLYAVSRRNFFTQEQTMELCLTAIKEPNLTKGLGKSFLFSTRRGHRAFQVDPEPPIKTQKQFLKNLLSGLSTGSDFLFFASNPGVSPLYTEQLIEMLISGKAASPALGILRLEHPVYQQYPPVGRSEIFLAVLLNPFVPEGLKEQLREFKEEKEVALAIKREELIGKIDLIDGMRFTKDLPELTAQGVFSLFMNLITTEGVSGQQAFAIAMLTGDETASWRNKPKIVDF